MKAVIMAGGQGKRLRPLTCDRPKPMVNVANKPIMEHIINLLKKHNIEDIAVTLQYMPDYIKDYFEDGKKYGVNLNYYIENEPLGTAGSVKNAGKFLDETFVIISGDALTNIDITEALKFHKNKNSKATIILKSVEVPLEYGVVVTNEKSEITNFLEKPNWKEVFSDTVNTGIYILEPEVLEYIKKDLFCDFSKDIFPKLLEDKIPLYGYVTKDYWCDIGDLKSYRTAHKDILDGKVSVEIMGHQIAPNVWIGDNVNINEHSTIKSPCIIGNNVRIEKGVHIEKYSVLGDFITVGKFSNIKQSIVWNNVRINEGGSLRGCVIADNTELKNNVSIYEGSVIGKDCEIFEYATIKPDVKIWPNKKVEKSSILHEHLVWGTKHTKNIFGKRGIVAKVTPEYITKLGLVYGSLLKGNGKIGIACSNKSVSKLVKMAFQVGMISEGIEVYDFSQILTPMLRLAIRFYRLDGGIYINDRGNDNTINIEILNKNGCNIESSIERKIENIYNQEDVIKCDVSQIKPIVSIDEYKLFYEMDIINKIRYTNMNLKIAVNTSSSMVKDILSKILNYMKCDTKFLDIKSKDFLYKQDEDKDIFSSFVKVGNFDLGVDINENGEKLTLIDKKGRVIKDDMYQILVILIQLIRGQKKIVVAPMTASSVIEDLAKQYGGEIKRTKSSVSELMNEMYKSNEPEIIKQFEMYFDAIYGLINVLEFMKQNNYTLVDVYDMIPKFYMNKIEVACKKTDKGKIIKELIKENSSKNIETTEGVKIYTKEGWVLVLPSVEKSSVGIISEGTNMEVAKELGIIFKDKISGIIDE